MAKPRKNNVSHRNIVLEINTYNQLQKFLVQLVKERGVPGITFNEAVDELLRRVVKR